eukprot:TRINITY_DN29064_c0_g1_i1.p1 TRINITY_DN29064_c0_g1~~TRINITY_DN29064_c0_g1_i1.p1  ORF type:complete len:522 (+),score=130.58 TRINITY_DN29064_c0_g1_i1:127-1692(+)
MRPTVAAAAVAGLAAIAVGAVVLHRGPHRLGSARRAAALHSRAAVPGAARSVPWCWGSPAAPSVRRRARSLLNTLHNSSGALMDCTSVNNTPVRVPLYGIKLQRAADGPPPRALQISKEYSRGRANRTLADPAPEQPAPLCPAGRARLAQCDADQRRHYRGEWQCIRWPKIPKMVWAPKCKGCKAMVRGVRKNDRDPVDPIALFKPETKACAPPLLPPGKESMQLVAQCLAGTTTVFIGNSNSREWMYALYELITGVLITRQAQKTECEPSCGFWLPGGGQVVFIRAEPAIFWSPQQNSQPKDSSISEAVRASLKLAYWLDDLARLQLRPDTLVFGFGLGDAFVRNVTDIEISLRRLLCLWLDDLARLQLRPDTLVFGFGLGDAFVRNVTDIEISLRRLLCLSKRFEAEGTRVYLKTLLPIRVHPGVHVHGGIVPGGAFRDPKGVAEHNIGINVTNELIERVWPRDRLLDEGALGQRVMGTLAESCTFADHIHAPPLMRASLRLWLGQHCPQSIIYNGTQT